MACKKRKKKRKYKMGKETRITAKKLSASSRQKYTKKLREAI